MITVYTTNCPRCKLLEQKLKSKKIQYEVNNNVDEMLTMGIETVPMMKIDDILLNFKKALAWVNNYNGVMVNV